MSVKASAQHKALSLVTGNVACPSFRLQDFLRNIPGSLLCMDLYDQWMDAMENEAGEEKIQSIQRWEPSLTFDLASSQRTMSSWSCE